MTSASENLRQELEGCSRDHGFVRFGVARAELLEPESTYLARWLAAGRHADMDWLPRTEAVRTDVRHEGMLPSAQSVIVLVTPYARESDRVGPDPGRIARYARGRDYHNVLRKRLRRLTSLLRERGHEARASVDSLPVFERAWAERSGVGFIGKNCCLIVPGLGSHVFLSTLVTDAVLAADVPMAQRCGSCRLCLDACPTKAFVAERELDARLCISYQTIENRGAVPMSLRGPVGDWLFGCDACQDCCPYNHGRLPDDAATKPFAAKDTWARLDAADLLELDEESFNVLTEGSPVRRAGRGGLARNAAIVLGNRGDKRHLPVLQRIAETDPLPIVQEAATWAVEQIGIRTGS